MAPAPAPAPAAVQTQAATVTSLKESASVKDSSYIPRGAVTATLNFFTAPEDGSEPFNWVEQQEDGRPQRNFGDAFVDVEINDIRNSESDFTLDKDAFQAVSGIASELTEADWHDDETIKRLYYPEIVKLILDKVPGSHKVTIFDHTVRREEVKSARGPVQRVHVDQTGRSTEWRVKLHDADESDELLKGRYRIINVWRSINGPVQSFPLAYASAASFDIADLRPVQHRYPHRTGETAAVQFNPSQKFYYWSGMDNDERVFLKCYDSLEGVGRSLPHTSFVDHRTPDGSKRRASIEVRALVYG